MFMSDQNLRTRRKYKVRIKTKYADIYRTCLRIKARDELAREKIKAMNKGCFETKLVGA